MLRTSGFVDDVVFPYNGGNRPESKTVVYVSSSSPSGSISRTSDNVVLSRSLGGGTGATSAISFAAATVTSVTSG